MMGSYPNARTNRSKSPERTVVDAALCSGWKFTHAASNICWSRTTVTRRCLSLIRPKGVTEPGVNSSTSWSSSGRAKENRGAARILSSRARSARLWAGITTSQMPPLRSLMNRLLQCRPGILSCQGRPSSTVKMGGCCTVLCSMPNRSSRAKSSSGVAATSIQRVAVRLRWCVGTRDWNQATAAPSTGKLHSVGRPPWP